MHVTEQHTLKLNKVEKIQICENTKTTKWVPPQPKIFEIKQ